MCRACISGNYRGLTVVTTDNINYQKLDEDGITKLDKDVINKVSSIHNIPIEFLFNKDKFALLEPFVNVCRLVFWSADCLKVDKNNFLVESYILSDTLALFQNLEELSIFDIDGGKFSKYINCTCIYQDKMIIFDGDSKIEKFKNIPQNVKYLNIISTIDDSGQRLIDEISDYNFLPNHIEELHFNNGYLLRNPAQTNLPLSLSKLKTNIHRTEKYMIINLYRNVMGSSKIPINCQFKIGEFA